MFRIYKLIYCICFIVVKQEPIGLGATDDHGSISSTELSSNSTFGRVNSFNTFKRLKGTQWKQSVSKKGKIPKVSEGKAQEDEVMIFIGLAEWNEKQDSLKRKHGKRLA